MKLTMIRCDGPGCTVTAAPTTNIEGLPAVPGWLNHVSLEAAHVTSNKDAMGVMGASLGRAGTFDFCCGTCCRNWVSKRIEEYEKYNVRFWEQRREEMLQNMNKEP